LKLLIDLSSIQFQLLFCLLTHNSLPKLNEGSVNREFNQKQVKSSQLFFQQRF